MEPLKSQLEHRGKFKWIRIHFTLHLPGTRSAVRITGGKIRQTGRLESCKIHSNSSGFKHT